MFLLQIVPVFFIYDFEEYKNISGDIFTLVL